MIYHVRLVRRRARMGGYSPPMSMINAIGRGIPAHTRSVLDQHPSVACFDLTFPPSKCIIGARSSTVRFADEARRGLKHHGEIKWPKSSSAESSSSSRYTTTSTFPKAGNRNHSSTRLNSSHVRISYAVFCL